jgi:hypothetical protein
MKLNCQAGKTHVRLQNVLQAGFWRKIMSPVICEERRMTMGNDFMTLEPDAVAQSEVRFNDRLLPIGAGFFVRLVEHALR